MHNAIYLPLKRSGDIGMLDPQHPHPRQIAWPTQNSLTATRLDAVTLRKAKSTSPVLSNDREVGNVRVPKPNFTQCR